MYQIKEQKCRALDQTVLIDTASGVSVTLSPSRGGVITGICRNGHEYLYLNEENLHADERPRCGVPIMFPACGRLENDVLNCGGKEYPMIGHGIAHLCAWQVASTSENDGASATLVLRADDFTRARYPFEFELRFTYTLRGNTISIAQEYENTGDVPMPFTYGFHPYFKVSKLENARVRLCAATVTVPATGSAAPFTQGEVTLPRESAGSAVLYAGVAGEAVLTDEVYGSRVRLSFDENSPYVMLWSMPACDFLCVEPWNGLPNGLNDGRHRTLAPGGTHRAVLTFTLED